MIIQPLTDGSFESTGVSMLCPQAAAASMSPCCIKAHGPLLHTEPALHVACRGLLHQIAIQILNYYTIIIIIIILSEIKM